jgi:hypothetical protein
MRASDLARLSEPYPPGVDNDARFAEGLGVYAAPVVTLYRDILADLDSTKHGVGWWAPHPGTTRRIAISDHLLLSVLSIQTNLQEARLHLLELADVSEQHSAFYADMVKLSGRVLTLHPPPRLTPRDDLPMRLSSLHTAGFFRGVVGTLDCLGAAIIGVAALPTDLLRASLVSARASLGKLAATSSLRADLHHAVENAIAGVGPRGWLEWATDYRNMLVHRARRTELWQLRPTPSPIVDFQGKPIVRAETIQQLARDPGRSEIEVLAQVQMQSGTLGAGDLVLTETARDTLEGVLASSLRLAIDVGTELLTLWRRRRSDPKLLLQPRKQWEHGVSTQTTGFQGYRPGSETYDPKALIANPAIRPLRWTTTVGRSGQPSIELGLNLDFCGSGRATYTADAA